MMNSIERSALVALLAAVAMTARADPPPIRNCVMADGYSLYADNGDQCKKDTASRTLDRDGTPKGAIPATATEWKSKPQGEKESRQEKCRARNKEQYQRDIALLERYPSEDDLQEARYRELGDELRRANAANERLKGLIAKARGFAEKVKFFEPPHRIPDDLRKDRDLNRELEQREFERIAGVAHEISRINERYDADLKRYRELMDGTARKPCDPNND